MFLSKEVISPLIHFTKAIMFSCQSIPFLYRSSSRLCTFVIRFPLAAFCNFSILLGSRNSLLASLSRNSFRNISRRSVWSYPFCLILQPCLCCSLVLCFLYEELHHQYPKNHILSMQCILSSVITEFQGLILIFEGWGGRNTLILVFMPA